MKNLILFLSLINCYSTFGQLINWQSEIIVADGNVYGNIRPRATVVGFDTPVVIFGQTGTTDNVHIARWNGSGFDTPITVLPSGQSSYMADWTGADISSKGDTVIAVFKLNPLESGHVYSVRSINGGITFSDTIRTDTHASGVAWMPSIEIKDDGTVLCSYMVHDVVWNNPRYAINRSLDAGLSYSAESQVSSLVPGEACDCCPSELVSNGQQEILLFRNNENNLRDLHAVLSNNAGATFNYFENIDQLNWTLSACPSTGADGAILNNSLFTAFASAASGKYKVYVSKSDLSDSIAFVDRMAVPEPNQSNGVQNYPRISANNDTVVMAWRENVSGNHEIFCSVSLPGQDPLVALTSYKQQSNATSSGTQTNPEIIVKNGIVHLFYQDNGSGDLIYRRGTIGTFLGINEVEIDNRIFPNPSNGKLYLPLNSKVTSVHTVDGKEIPFVQIEKEINVELEVLSSQEQFMFVTYELEDRTFTEKIIISNK